MEFSSYEHGQPSWVDLGSPDVAASGTFYAELFGWRIEEGPPETGGYCNCTLGGRRVAGLGPQQAPGPSYWSHYVNVDDAAAIVAKVRELGGQVLVEPMPVLDLGTMAVCADSIGAVFGVWQPGTHTGAEVANESGTWCWSELLSTDLDASKAFYSALFGWVPEDQAAAPAGAEGAPMQYTEWKLNGRAIGGMMAMPPMMPAGVPPHWGIYFAVDDTDATVAKVAELGGAVMMPPMDIQPGRFAVVADTAGATFNVIALNQDLGS